MIPLIILSLGCLFCQKVGFFNVGSEGIALIGALIYSIIVKFLLNKWLGYSAIFAFFIAIIIGIVLGFLQFIAISYFKTNGLIVAFGFYYLGLSLVGWLSWIIFKKNHFTSNDIYINNYPIIFLILNFILIFFISFILLLTKFGLHLKVAASNPFVLTINRIDFTFIQLVSIISGNALICLAGAFFVYQNGQFNGSINNIGWLALAVVSLVKNKIILIILFSYFITFFVNLANDYFAESLLKNNVNALAIFLSILPYLLPLIFLLFLNFKKIPLNENIMLFNNSEE